MTRRYGILIVDDEPAFRRQLQRLLACAGLSVVGEAGRCPSNVTVAVEPAALPMYRLPPTTQVVPPLRLSSPVLPAASPT